VRTLDIVLLSILGLIIWIAGTIYYAHAGPAILETTGRRYWINFIVLPLASLVLCIGIFRWRDIPSVDWSAAALLLAIPGMLGEAFVLVNFATFMPKVHSSSGGRYGAILFVTYAVVLAVAEVVTLKSR
jgi:hypothetical protein